MATAYTSLLCVFPLIFFALSSDDSAADPNVHSDLTIAKAQQTGMANHSQRGLRVIVVAEVP